MGAKEYEELFAESRKQAAEQRERASHEEALRRQQWWGDVRSLPEIFKRTRVQPPSGTRQADPRRHGGLRGGAEAQGRSGRREVRGGKEGRGHRPREGVRGALRRVAEAGRGAERKSHLREGAGMVKWPLGGEKIQHRG